MFFCLQSDQGARVIPDTAGQRHLCLLTASHGGVFVAVTNNWFGLLPVINDQWPVLTETAIGNDCENAPLDSVSHLRWDTRQGKNTQSN